MGDFFLLSIIAGVMVAIIVFLLHEAERVKSKLGFSLVIFGFVMMITMFLGASFYLLFPSKLSLAEAILINNFTMVAYILLVFPFIKKFKVKFEMNSISSLSISLLAVANEILMSLTFNIACEVNNLFYFTFNGGWFFYPMMVEMLSIYLIHYIEGEFRKDLFPLIGITSFPPTLIDNIKWFYSSLAISLALSGLGVINSKGFIRWIYVILILSLLLLLFKVYIIYDVAITVSMITYYFSLLSQ
ncbi:hypothetical protein D1867_10400 [Acidianus infernus]|uniref:Uncharacterized protein n=1 Tax=Acidianus infernus TaxID=12915 RepID=A0A6A9QIJ6_ACIIN|nr:hypothetical protein [Acidianus infernus]MUM65643.1 hypothetical protein [Acidianus infernus]